MIPIWDPVDLHRLRQVRDGLPARHDPDEGVPDRPPSTARPASFLAQGVQVARPARPPADHPGRARTTAPAAACASTSARPRARPTSSHKAINMEPVADAPRRRARRAGTSSSRIPPLDREPHRRTTRSRARQVLEPLFEFSGACGGCGETPYLRLVSQLFGDRMIVANATGCSSIYGANLPTTPWTVNAAGRGPAWSNSLFEDNAEFGLGHAPRARRPDRPRPAAARAARARASATDLVRELLDASQDDRGRDRRPARAGRPRCATRSRGIDGAARVRRPAPAGARRRPRPQGRLDHRRRRLGLRHRLRRRRPGAVAPAATSTSWSSTPRSTRTPAARPPRRRRAAPSPSSRPPARAPRKKDLGAIARSYGNVYVAQVAMGANDLQTTKALLEADAWPGPSLVIAYSTCIAHGIDMSKSMSHQKDAVKSGYWPLYRFQPVRGRGRHSRSSSTRATPSIPIARLRGDRDPLRGPRSGPTRSGPPSSRRWPRPTPTSAGATTSSWPASSARVPHIHRPDPDIVPEVESDAGYRYEREGDRA